MTEQVLAVPPVSKTRQVGFREKEVLRVKSRSEIPDTLEFKS